MPCRLFDAAAVRSPRKKPTTKMGGKDKMERYCQSTPTQQQQAAKQGPIEEANESLTATFKLDVRNPFARPPLQAMSTTPNLAADARPGALRRLRESFARGFSMGATKPTAPSRVGLQ
ncbi:uncharacterized protein CCOS01_16879 [Colletotrichum costaricense]|uniref:Uncharacterized protein n=2 Tax=Colletotrichum acutatum species complex TaxID=2707335 RepID=A0AAI9YES8_9PEZI|nr:uncharacterized protein CCOS01_16879 [Colletotrichum costaricense]XP_060379730.1 uncharacterized protein CTAM01_09643 [Colletotrichum tamarilloi]KAI3527110.1 hypothetical protein CSPX01_17237 [Colletotrichum filicis]KAK1493016.1 hypothetical protein CTAM01_09643 [Colletotrichum tamarilloi]KAK1504427.1 hypothetical protein CCOS01_16879 [Colletotrichum costaricense]